jgi:hypothetical protein
MQVHPSAFQLWQDTKLIYLPSPAFLCPSDVVLKLSWPLEHATHWEQIQAPWSLSLVTYCIINLCVWQDVDVCKYHSWTKTCRYLRWLLVTGDLFRPYPYSLPIQRWSGKWGQVTKGDLCVPRCAIEHSYQWTAGTWQDGIHQPDASSFKNERWILY